MTSPKRVGVTKILICDDFNETTLGANHEFFALASNDAVAANKGNQTE